MNEEEIKFLESMKKSQKYRNYVECECGQQQFIPMEWTWFDCDCGTRYFLKIDGKWYKQIKDEIWVITPNLGAYQVK